MFDHIHSYGFCSVLVHGLFGPSEVICLIYIRTDYIYFADHFIVLEILRFEFESFMRNRNLLLSF